MLIDGTGALVVGGASGLGAATARALHEQGAQLVIADLDAARGEALAASLEERARFVKACASRCSAPASATRSDSRAAAARTGWTPSSA